MDRRDANIGAYQIRGRLGAGGMGEVLLAYDARLRRHVAIKRIRHDVETTPERRRRFRREARAAAGLSHPAIVQIHDILEDDDGDSIVMEYVEGRSLDRLLDDGGVDAAMAVDLARQVAEGLAAAHQRGIVHRDLKAENVMVMPDGRARILDFGLAKPPPLGDPDAALTQEGAVLGTLRVMAPEQAAGRRVDERSDLYSLGVLLYEALTGRPPFTGGDVAELFDQVMTVEATPPDALRPGLPPALSSLVVSLLAKDPARRPATARQVADALAEIAASAGVEGLGPAPRTAAVAASSTAPSDAPTLVSPRAPESARPPRESAASGRRRGRVGRWAVLGGALLALASVVYLLLPAAAARRVVVVRPEVSRGAMGDTDLAVLGVQEAVLATLRSLAGVEALDPAAVGEGPRSVVEAARATAADEAVAATLESRGAALWISLRRLGGEDGKVIWSSGPFEVPNRPELYLQMAEAVGSRLRQAYPGRRLRRGVPALEVRDRDYVAYLELQRRPLVGRNLDEPELDELEALLESSPRFLAGRLLAAAVARSLGQLGRARAHLERAVSLAPGDPRLHYQRARVEIDAGRLDEAERAIAELGRRAPGDLRIALAEAQLLERRGELREAVAVWRRIVDRRASWEHLYGLAAAEMRMGDVERSRAHLGQLLAISPKNPFGRSRLAHLELNYGDLEKAERLYRELIEDGPERRYLTNLGNTLYLRGRYAAAAESFREALELAPGHPLARLNLADAELAAGHLEEARALYRELLDELRDDEDARGFDARLSMVHAQCLVRLGDARRAVEITQRTLKRHPDHASVTFQAAAVYALAGERHSALASAEEAVALGWQRRWLDIPAFDSLRSEPGFVELLAARPGLRQP